jgi:uncharacterized protein (TIGR02145 family)
MPMKKVIFLLFVISFFTSGCKKDNNGDSTSAGTVTDVDGNVYHTVKIGSQTWMVENLKTTRYNDGTSIMLVTDNNEWSKLGTNAAYCWYENDSASYIDSYGALYNWTAANSDKLAPGGWHVATDADWTTLTNYLGGEREAGGKLKVKGTGDWLSPNTGATNEVGFAALPSGYRSTDGTFTDNGISGDWWSASEVNDINAWFRGVGYNLAGVSRVGLNKVLGLSVRCVK